MVAVLRTEKQKAFRKEVSKLASKANKRLKRLGESDFNSSPAYQKWLKEGGEYFSIRGKSQQDVWQEYYRVKSYLDSKTSSITGTKEVLLNMNEYTGMNLESIEDVKEVASDYFELANKISQYVNVKGLGAIYDSNQIYSQINLVTQEMGVDLTNADFNDLLNYVTSEIDKDYYLNQNDNDNDLGFYKKLT